MNYALWKQQLSMPEVLDCLEPGTICTPFALIEEIIDKLPINWSNPNLKFLDPTCGRGSFLFVIKQRLLQAGHSEQHIVENMLYGMDIAKRNVDFTKIILDPENKYKNNIEWGNSLIKDWDMKFDVVVGNPPYQAELKTLQNRLWMQFVDKAFELLKDKGYLAYITPSNWAVTPELYQKWFLSHNPIIININECGKYFPGINIDFSWYIIQHTPYKNTIVTFVDQVGTHTGLLPPVFGNNYGTLSIIEKVWNSVDPKLIDAVAPHTHYSYRKAGKVSDVKTDVFNVKVLASPKTSKKDAQWVWGKTICSKQTGPRVIGYTFPGSWKDMIVSTTLQTVHNFIHIPTSTEEEAINLRDVLTSKLFLFVVYQTNSSRGIKVNTIQRLPKVDLSRSWTDEELYAHFNLTEEEIKLIEETIK